MVTGETHGGRVIVTGAGSGIGAAIARRFGRAGWSVALGDIDGAAVARVAAEVGGWCGQVDVADHEAARRFVVAAADAVGGVDVLVNNAGVFHVAPLANHDLEAWRRVFAVNVEGPLSLMQAVAPLMATQAPDRYGCRGRIINMGSPAAEAPRPFLPAYGASKAALRHLSRSADAAFGPAGIRVVLVYPTNVEEGMWARLPADLSGATGEAPADVVAARLAETPSGGFQAADDVADVVYYAATAPAAAGKLIWTEAHLIDL